MTIALGCLPASGAFASDLELLLLAEHLPRPIPGGYVEASATVLTPTRRPPADCRARLEGALRDVLVDGGWLPDDRPGCLRFGHVLVEHRVGVRGTRIRLGWSA